MPRTFQDVTDIVHAWLLGVFCAYACWVYANRALYSSASLSRMNMIISLVMILRLLTTVRLETTLLPICYIWIFVRGIITSFTAFALNIYFITELFLNIVVAVRSKPQAQRRWWRYGIHGATQGFNLINLIQAATNVIPIVSPAKFCALTFVRGNQPLAYMTVTSFAVCLAMTIALASSKSAFSVTVPEFARLFRILTVSSGFLSVWIMYAQLDVVLLPWEDWKSFNVTIMLTWMSVNSVIANNYLIGLSTKSSTTALSTQARSVVGTASTSGKVSGEKSPSSAMGLMPPSVADGAKTGPKSSVPV